MLVTVTTSDKYLYSLRIYAHFFNKYWGQRQEVDVMGFSSPDFDLPKNFSFTSVGAQSRYPIHRWSDALIDYLSTKRDHKTVVLMLEDMWFTRKVDTRAVKYLNQYMLEHPEVAKIDLYTDRLYSANVRDYGSLHCYDLLISDPNSPYHMSLMAGIWNIDNLLRVLERGETPWDVELRGTPRLRDMEDLIVLGTRQSPINHILAHRSGDPGKTYVKGLSWKDVEELRKRGWVE